MTDHKPRPPRRFARPANLLLLLLLSLSFTGCYSTEESGDTATIRFTPAVRAILTLIPFGIVGGLLCVCYFRILRIPALIAVVPVILCSGLLVPGMVLDRVEITPKEISQTTGFWFAQHKKGFRYDQVESVTIRDGKEGQFVIRIWQVRYKDGTTQEIDPGDLWSHNEEFVVRKLRSYGVVVNAADEQGVPQPRPARK